MNCRVEVVQPIRNLRDDQVGRRSDHVAQFGLITDRPFRHTAENTKRRVDDRAI